MKWFGLGVMVAAEVLLWFRIPPVPRYFTPLAWTGYILFLDGWVFERTGKSLIRNRTGEFVWMSALSIFLWLVFEWYNWTVLYNWDYINLPANAFEFQVGTLWSFATVTPAIIETDEWLEAYHQGTPPPGKDLDERRKIPWWLTVGAVAFGLFGVSIPYFVQPDLAPHLSAFVWCGFPFLLDPLNARWGGRSFIRELVQGHWGRLGRLFLAGLICGLCWEFWNFWAETKWVYTVPGPLGQWKVFEMPLAGYLGFMAFGVEVWVMWETCRLLLARLGLRRFGSYAIKPVLHQS